MHLVVFFSLKDATDFSARRRTLYMFEQGVEAPKIWIDNTPQLWTELRAELDRIRPQTM